MDVKEIDHTSPSSVSTGIIVEAIESELLGKRDHIHGLEYKISRKSTNSGNFVVLLLSKSMIGKGYVLEEDLNRRAQEKLLLIFLTILQALHLLCIRASSQHRKTHVLLWSDKAMLLVLWTCGDVEQNPGPAIKILAKSEVLRKFQRCSQTPILRLIYEKSETEIPKPLYSQPPPGWKKDDKFENISNLNKGGEEIFDGLILLFKKKWNPLPRKWDVLLKHYQNLKENNDVASKNALERWMLEVDIVPKLILYDTIDGESSADILEACKNIVQREQHTHRVTESTCNTTLSRTSNEGSEISYSSSSKSAANEKRVQSFVVSDRTNSMLRAPSTKGGNKSENHVLQREETAPQGYASLNPDTEMIQAMKGTHSGKSNRGTAEQLKLNPDLFKHVTKSNDHQLFAGKHKVRTTNKLQLKRRLPDEEPTLNNSKVQRNHFDICEKNIMIENIQLLQPRAERLKNDMQRKNNVEQSPMVIVDSEKRKSFNESSPDSTVSYDMDIFQEEDELDEDLKNKFYQEVPLFLRTYLSQLGSDQPSAEVAELCEQILNIYTCRGSANEIKLC